MRKAFTLIELLVLVTVIPFLMVITTGVFAVLARDVPQATRLVQRNTTVLDMLRQISMDMDEATGLPEQFDGKATDDKTLLIERSDGVVCYQLRDGQVVRTLLSGPVSEGAGDPVASNPQSAIRNPQLSERVWRVPGAVITWRTWTREGQAYAVEVHSHLPQRVEDQVRKKFANSHVYFIGGLGKERKVR